MATYTTDVNQIMTRLKAKGVPEDRARNMAEKQASAKRKRSNPGRVQNKRNRFKGQKPPDPPKSKVSNEDIKKFADSMVMEIYGITGLIAPSNTISGGPVGAYDAASPTTGAKALAGKYTQQQDNDDPTKVHAKSGKTQGFKATGGLKAKVTRAKAGSVTKAPPSFESIEEEFGIR